MNRLLIFFVFYILYNLASIVVALFYYTKLA